MSDRLEEIKKRYELKWDLSFAYFNVDDFAWLKDEVERLESIVDTYDILAMDSLLRQVDELTKENKELREGSSITKPGVPHIFIAHSEVQAMREEITSLKAEVERLEYAVEAMQDTANKDKVRHREQIESLTKELEEAIGKHGPASGFWGRTCARQQKEIKDLETQLTESKKKVEELWRQAACPKHEWDYLDNNVQKCIYCGWKQ